MGSRVFLTSSDFATLAETAGFLLFRLLTRIGPFPVHLWPILKKHSLTFFFFFFLRNILIVKHHRHLWFFGTIHLLVWLHFETWNLCFDYTYHSMVNPWKKEHFSSAADLVSFCKVFGWNVFCGQLHPFVSQFASLGLLRIHLWLANLYHKTVTGR